MPWPVHPTGFFGAADVDTYKVERSLRFNSADSAYLSRTPASAGNRKTWTWSGWVKRASIADSGETFFTGYSATTDETFLTWNADTIRFFSRTSNLTTAQLDTSALYRDISAWYHVVLSVDTTQATASSRLKLYVNGSEVTAFGVSTYPSQNSDFWVNNTVAHNIGRRGNAINYLSSYLTEINFIDGQALTPSSFGETDSVTGRWKVKKYSGTYGTNGFYLNFADNSGTTATTLGKDLSGNGNNWTPNNFSVTAGAGNDSLLDSPTNSGTSGNYCVVNPLKNDTSFTSTNGNLDVTLANETGGRSCSGTFAISYGKFYWEATVTANAGNRAGVGIATSETSTANYSGSYSSGYTYEGSTGDKITNGTSSSYGSTFTTNDVIGVALDMDNGSLVFYKNGSSQGTAYSGLSGVFNPRFDNTGNVASTSVSYSINFGQRPFAYTAPTGFKALCTTNLPTPTIKKPSTAMDVVTYTGTGASNSISSLGFSPDLVWIKNRGTTTDHALYDTVRGATIQLSSNTTGAEATSSTGLTAFGSSGFTLGTSSLVNTSGTQYVAWAWDAGSTTSTNNSGTITSTVSVNPTAGFSIVSYTGTGANATVGHGLGVAPKMVIIKSRSQGGSAAWSWVVWHSSFSGLEYAILNSTAAKASASTIWNSTAPSSSLFNIGTDAVANSSTVTYIAYCFSEIEGYSKFGSYTGNGSSDGPFVWCGFRPRWVMIKRTDSTGGWTIIDSSRDTYNISGSEIQANTSAAEATGQSSLDAISGGFKMRNTAIAENASGGTYIFAAFAESPFKYARAR